MTAQDELHIRHELRELGIALNGLQYVSIRREQYAVHDVVYVIDSTVGALNRVMATVSQRRSRGGINHREIAENLAKQMAMRVIGEL